MMSEDRKWRRLHHLPLALFVITMIAVALGGAVRIHDAGVSCPDWPQCFGTWGFDISPEEQAEWWEENPEEIKSNEDKITYETWEIFLEWIHRFVTGIILGPLCILQWYLAYKRKATMPGVYKASSIALILVIVQGAMGMITVLYDNIPWSVAAHLTLAMALALSLLWAWVRWMEAERELPQWMELDSKRANRLRPRLYDLSLSTLLVLILGAFVSSTEGQNATCGVGDFSAWPLCNGHLFDSIVDNIQFGHRVAVVVVGGWLIWNVRGLERGTVRKLLHSGIGLYVLNLLVGGAYILTWSGSFIEILSLAHLLLGSLSFLCIGFAALLARNATLAPLIAEDE